MIMKIIKHLFVALLLIQLISACSHESNTQDADEQQEEETVEVTEVSDTGHDDESDYNWDNETITSIILSGNTVTFSGTGVAVDGTTVTINAGGNYSLSGTLYDGRIIVDSDDEQLVRVILDGVDLTSLVSAPLAVMNAEQAMIVVNEGTVNTLTDAASYIYDDSEEDEPDAALFSDDDLTIYGSGELIIHANYKEAIKSKDGLVLNDVDLVIDSDDDGIQGKDYLIIRSGQFNISATGDGLKSNNDEDSELGYILIEDGDFVISAQSDALQAETGIRIEDGSFDLSAGGGSSAVIGDDDSAKGIKAGVGIEITGGDFAIDVAEDGIHSDGDIIISAGTFAISSADDAIHADEMIVINGGSILVTEAYEGIEAASITINDGEIDLTTSDDALNAASDNANNYLYINGGYIVIHADGDGIDANGYIEMTDGIVLVHGPTANNNGALDYDDSFIISGGLLIATGSSRMAQAPGYASTQASVLVAFNSAADAGSLFHVERNDGTVVLTFAPDRTYQSVAFSSGLLEIGQTYSIYLGGSSTGVEDDGLYSGGVYSAGNLYQTLNLSNIVTVVR